MWLNDGFLQEMTIDLLENESEAIVRREAMNLIKELYVHKKWSYVEFLHIYMN